MHFKWQSPLEAYQKSLRIMFALLVKETNLENFVCAQKLHERGRLILKML